MIQDLLLGEKALISAAAIALVMHGQFGQAREAMEQAYHHFLYQAVLHPHGATKISSAAAKILQLDLERRSNSPQPATIQPLYSAVRLLLAIAKGQAKDVSALLGGEAKDWGDSLVKRMLWALRDSYAEIDEQVHLALWRCTGKMHFSFGTFMSLDEINKVHGILSLMEEDELLRFFQLSDGVQRTITFLPLPKAQSDGQDIPPKAALVELGVGFVFEHSAPHSFEVLLSALRAVDRTGRRARHHVLIDYIAKETYARLQTVSRLNNPEWEELSRYTPLFELTAGSDYSTTFIREEKRSALGMYRHFPVRRYREALEERGWGSIEDRQALLSMPPLWLVAAMNVYPELARDMDAIARLDYPEILHAPARFILSAHKMRGFLLLTRDWDARAPSSIYSYWANTDLTPLLGAPSSLVGLNPFQKGVLLYHAARNPKMTDRRLARLIESAQDGTSEDELAHILTHYRKMSSECAYRRDDMVIAALTKASCAPQEKTLQDDGMPPRLGPLAEKIVDGLNDAIEANEAVYPLVQSLKLTAESLHRGHLPMNHTAVPIGVSLRQARRGLSV